MTTLQELCVHTALKHDIQLDVIPSSVLHSSASREFLQRHYIERMLNGRMNLLQVPYSLLDGMDELYEKEYMRKCKL